MICDIDHFKQINDPDQAPKVIETSIDEPEKMETWRRLYRKAGTRVTKLVDDFPVTAK